MTIESREQEIARIERELEILRARHASYDYWGDVLKKFFAVGLPVLGVAVLAAAIILGIRFYRALDGDYFYGAFIAGFLLLILFLGWIVSSQPQLRQRPFRWIDVASSTVRPDFSGAGGDLIDGQRSDAEILEEQIAGRQKRLSQLKGGSS